MLTSVIIPTFQRADCIGEAIASVARQPVEDLEIVVVDDGSTDGTADIVERWIGGDRRIRLLRQSNQGVVAARNRGLESARGSLIAFLDSEDPHTQTSENLLKFGHKFIERFSVSYEILVKLSPRAFTSLEKYLLCRFHPVVFDDDVS